VIQFGNFAFGRPSRITARVRIGKGEVVNIEREVDLSGPIHSKGVLILSSFLSARYAVEKPLSLAASLVFEQSYSGVEGDSASSAELFVLLSAIAEVPIRQSLAVTGAVNQHGGVQAVAQAFGATGIRIETSQLGPQSMPLLGSAQVVAWLERRTCRLSGSSGSPPEVPDEPPVGSGIGGICDDR
jgi:hypothetical protein